MTQCPDNSFGVVLSSLAFHYVKELGLLTSAKTITPSLV